MKLNALLLAVVAGAACALSAPASAQPDDAAPPPKIDRAKLLERFDADGDGRLDQKERAAAQKAVQRRLGQGRAGADRPAAGPPDRPGQRAMRGQGQPGDQANRPQQRPGQRGAQRQGNQGGKAMGPPNRPGQRAMRGQGQPPRGQANRPQQRPGQRAMRGQDRPARPQARRGQDRSGVRQRAANRPQLRQRLLKRFDADGDGRLGPKERGKAQKALRNRLKNAPRGQRGSAMGPRGQRRGPIGHGGQGRAFAHPAFPGNRQQPRMQRPMMDRQRPHPGRRPQTMGQRRGAGPMHGQMGPGLNRRGAVCPWCGSSPHQGRGGFHGRWMRQGPAGPGPRPNMPQRGPARRPVRDSI